MARKPFGERGDAVAFLHAQFLGVVDFNSLFREWPERGEHGKLVNHFGNLRARDGATRERGVAHRDITNQFTVLRSARETTCIGAPMEIRKSMTLARVGFTPTLWSISEDSGHDQRGGRSRNTPPERSPGTTSWRAGELWARMNAIGASRAFELGAEFAQGHFGVVARGDRFAHGGEAISEKSGEQNRGLHLGAGNGRGVVDGVEMAAANFDGGAVAFTRLDLRRPSGAAARSRAAWGAAAATRLP